MKKLTGLILLAALAALALGCLAAAAEAPAAEVVVLYTNDVHSYINNEGLRYASIAALRDELVAEGRQVILVDAGDHVQGTAYGDMDDGKTVIELMNAAGYQLAVPGNHEFDYGQFRFFGILEQAQFPYLSCNFYKTSDGSPVLAPYKVLEAGGVRVAFVGICTPETITTSAPIYFMNETLTEYLYGFYGGEDGGELYSAVQAAIDAVRGEADYVIALGHLGVDPASAPYRSIDVISHTTGLDAFIDGHSHSTVPGEAVLDAAGRPVILTQTGSYLKNIGKMTLKGGSVSTELISEYAGSNAQVAAISDNWVAEVDALLGEKIAVVDSTLYIKSPEDSSIRIVRNSETNLADLMADGYYYYFNDVLGLDCDITLQNGGGVRAQIEAGDFSYKTAKTAAPFGNVACLVEVSGQAILDALEKGAMKVGVKNPETGLAAENGGFAHVAGLKYTISSEVESGVVVNSDGLWLSGPAGEYKVRDVAVYNRESGRYEPLDVTRSYTVGGINYMLRDMGDGMAMFSEAVPVLDYVLEDYLVLCEYVKAFEKGEDGYPHIQTAASPLYGLTGYLINYENPYGAGRIVIE